VRMAEPRAAGDLDGVVLFPALPGTCLRDTFEQGGRLPDPSRLIGILEGLAAAPWRGDPDPGRPDLAIRTSGRLLAQILPHRRQEIRDRYHELMERVSRPLPETFTVHGDLYEGQIFIDDAFSLGLIDLEDGGIGDPLLDAANMLAHLTVLHAYAPEAGGRPLAYRALLRRTLLEHLGGGDEDLAWREAYGALHLATGPFRTQSPDWVRETEARLDAVARLMDARPIAVPAA
ncbi:MAG: phosphotransferase, partial [Actinomycetota bacterium]